MKTLIAALMLLSAAAAAPVDSLARLRQLFPKPPAEFGTLPFFVWNGEITEAVIGSGTQGLLGTGRSRVHHSPPARIDHGVPLRPWFQLVRYTVDRAKKLGMEVWLYDENSYASVF